MKSGKTFVMLLSMTLALLMLLPGLTGCQEGGEGLPDTTLEETADTTAEHTTPNDTTQDGDLDSTEPDTEAPGTDADTETETETETEGQTEEQPEPVVVQSLPILRIETTDGGDVTSKDYYKSCTITLENCTDPLKFGDVTASIRVRGNSTAVAEKKPFRIKFDSKRNVLGLNGGAKCKSWCLMADYYDHSLMRNSLSFRLCEQLLDGYSFASDCAWVEVYLNGDYRGVYLLCEQTQINKNRVDIYEKQDEETNTEIGYLMVGQGGRTDEPNTVQISYGNLPMKDLDGTQMSFGGGNFSLSSGDYTQEQIDFCAKVVGNIARLTYYAIIENEYYELDESWELVRKTEFSGTTDAERQIETVSAYVDIESALRMYMTDEIVKNLDSGTFNMYIDLSPTGDRKLTFGPPWDFDFALANTKYGTTHSPKGMYAANFSVSDGMRVNTWYVLFCQAQWFRDMCKPLWMEQRDALFAICESIPADAKAHQDAFDRNFDRWRIMGHMTQGHQADDVYVFTSHADAADFVYTWLYKRLTYLDTVWGDRVPTEPEGNEYFSKIDFTKNDYSDMFEGFNSCSGLYSQVGYYRLRLTGDGHDPYVHIKYADSGAELDADDYSVIEITYRAPSSNSAAEYSAEIFLCAGEYMHPTGGVSVRFDTVADGTWHTVRVPIPYQYWNGEIHQIRLDFFGGGRAGDTFDLESIYLTN